MVQGILADIHVRGPVEVLVREMQTEPWSEFWKHLDLALFHFEDVGLVETASDLEVWLCCQTHQLVLITDNRNADSPESLEATIRKNNSANCLPVFTIANLNNFRLSRAYAERVLKRFYEYLLEIDQVRGTGRLFLP